jgi:arylsulfatase A-like enzyme
MSVFLDYLLPRKRPDLTLIWNRNPDTAQHWYGPGTPKVKLALRELDGLLGKLLDRLTELGWLETTNVVVVSDHGHSSVSGPLTSFPLRAIAAKVPGEARVGERAPSGYSVSGEVRLADLLTRIGKFRAYDGLGCLFNPVLSGIAADGKPLYRVSTDDRAGTVCGKDAKSGLGGARYTTPAYRLPAVLPPDAVVVAVNGGSDYVYVPSHEPGLVERVVRFLQERPEVGAMFLGSRYSAVAGTLPMTAVHAESKDPRRNPDLVVSYDYDEHAVIAGMPGITYAGAHNYRGMHGSFSPVDVRNTLIAFGPDFRRSFRDTLPTGNVDVAPTLAKILGLTLPQADGRSLDEALIGAAVPLDAYRVETPEPLTSSTVAGLRVLHPLDTDGTRVDRGKTRYRATLRTRRLSRDGRSYTYFDSAKATRD